MKHKEDFRLQPLLTETKTPGVVSGPMSPVLAAQTFCKVMKELSNIPVELHGLCRIVFYDAEYNNWYEDPSKQGLTGCDSLLLCEQYSNDLIIYFFIDEGVRLVPVSFYFHSSHELIVSNIYAVMRDRYAKSLDDSQIMEIMKSAVEHDAFRIKKMPENVS